MSLIFSLKNMKKTSILLKILLLLFFAHSSFAQVPPTTDSRIRTLVYNPNEVYELTFFYGYQSFIEFSTDEEIEMISIGEAFAWRLTPAGKRLFVRPLEIAAHTNMTIITNRRTYHFDIRSSEYNGKADETLVYTVRFFYPQIGQPLPIPPQLATPNPVPAAQRLLVKTPTPLPKMNHDLPGIVDRNPMDNPINFDYSLAGKADNISPIKVYDDGKETFFQFSNDNLVIPSISIVDVNGREQLMPYVIRDGYVVISSTGRQFSLRLGDALLCVYNNPMLIIKK
jgi:type IV secretion system protein VirB9